MKHYRHSFLGQSALQLASAVFMIGVVMAGAYYSIDSSVVAGLADSFDAFSQLSLDR